MDWELSTLMKILKVLGGLVPASSSYSRPMLLFPYWSGKLKKETCS
ncbi:hypothetical protein CPK_ORF00389 [Chlamydia pneumoniae LPCoLN]|nr:hypothetical protein CPK_ORF00389 [Chlamydia pneumoniae LPCoLN]